MASQLNLCLQECFCARSGADTSHSRIPRRLTPAIEKLQESPRHSMFEAQERSPNLNQRMEESLPGFMLAKPRNAPVGGGQGEGRQKLMMKHIGSGLKINMTHKRSCLRPPPFFGSPPSPRVLFAYSYTLPPEPLLLLYEEAPDCSSS